MKIFDWDELREKVKEWHDLYDSLMNLLDEKGCEIEAPLYTMVKTGPHEYGKFRISEIKKVKSDMLVDTYMSLICVNDEDKLEISVFRAFELKTDGKIRDIELILHFIKTEISKKKVVNLEPTIL